MRTDKRIWAVIASFILSTLGIVFTIIGALIKNNMVLLIGICGICLGAIIFTILLVALALVYIRKKNV